MQIKYCINGEERMAEKEERERLTEKLLKNLGYQKAEKKDTGKKE